MFPPSYTFPLPPANCRILKNKKNNRSLDFGEGGRIELYAIPGFFPLIFQFPSLPILKTLKSPSRISRFPLKCIRSDAGREALDPTAPSLGSTTAGRFIHPRIHTHDFLPAKEFRGGNLSGREDFRFATVPLQAIHHFYNYPEEMSSLVWKKMRSSCLGTSLKIALLPERTASILRKRRIFDTRIARFFRTWAFSSTCKFCSLLIFFVLI